MLPVATLPPPNPSLLPTVPLLHDYVFGRIVPLLPDKTSLGGRLCSQYGSSAEDLQKKIEDVRDLGGWRAWGGGTALLSSDRCLLVCHLGCATLVPRLELSLLTFACRWRTLEKRASSSRTQSRRGNPITAAMRGSRWAVGGLCEGLAGRAAAQNQPC